MTNPAIKECSNPGCGNTWEVRNETDARRETCNPCHFRTIATAVTARDENQNDLHRINEKLKAIERSRASKLGRRVSNLGRDAARTAAVIDPRLHPDSGYRRDPPHNMPGELLGAARDLADYLCEDRIPPETNRHGIPHATGWDLGHAMYLVRNLALQLDEARPEVPESARIRCLQELLNLAIEIALVSSDKRNHPLLDQLVAGSPVNPKNPNAQ